MKNKMDFYLNGVEIDPKKIEFTEGEFYPDGMYFKGSNVNLLLPNEYNILIRKIK